MNRSYRHTTLIRLMAISLLLLVKMQSVCAQRISFSTWTGSDEISLRSPQGVMSGLDFNQKKAAIVANSEAITIAITDNQAVIFEIEAPEHFDLTLEVDVPTVLTLHENPAETIPIQLRIAYNNMNPVDEQTGKLNAVELPLGFNSISFPVNRRLSGAPGPPPTPEHGGYTRPKGKVFIYLYGTLGPIGAVPPGTYEGNITINVSFTSYEED